MKLKFKLLLAAFILVVFSFGFSNQLSNSAQPVLIRIEIKTADDLNLLRELPLSARLRTDDYVIASISSDKLSLLTDAGFSIEILDEQEETDQYYSVQRSHFRPLGALPTESDVLFQTDRTAIIKAPADVTKNLINAGFQTTKLPDLPISLNVSKKSKLQELNLKRLQDPVIDAIIQQVSDARITAAVQRLQNFQTRYSGSDSIYTASQWIYDEFKSYGYEDVKFDTLDVIVMEKLQRNVIVTKPGRTYPDSVIIIGGHYDSVVYDGTNPMLWAPGANDNASGTVAAMEAARLLADIELEATVIFACWAAEEQGLYGAWDYVQKAVAQDREIDVYINFDMIGNLDNHIRDVSVFTDQASYGFAELMSEMALMYTTLEPIIRPAGGGSDHWPFMQMGYNIIYAEEADFSPNWHKSTDIIENMDIHYCNEVIRMGLATLLHLAGPPPEITGPYVRYKTVSFDDDNSQSSVGNDNGYLDPGETIELNVSLENIGIDLAEAITGVLQTQDKYVTIIDSINIYGDIAPNDSASNPNPFIFSISKNIPANRTIVFSIRATATSNEFWDSTFLLKLTQPVLTFQNYSVTEITGDNDQIPDVGETFNLFLQIGNFGTRPANDVVAILHTYDPDVTIIDNEATIETILQDSVGENISDPFVVQINDSALPHRVKFIADVQEGAGFFNTKIEFNLLLEQGKVLLVIDDGFADKSQYYTQILDELGVPFETWQVIDQGDVPQNIILDFENIIWFTGLEPVNTLTPDDQSNLQVFLDNGGSLLLSGQMIGLNIQNSEFYSNYLHAKFIHLRTGLHYLNTVAENPVTDLTDVSLATSGDNLQTLTSENDPITPGFSLFTYDTTSPEGPGNIQSSGTAMIGVDNSTYKLIFCGFGFEGFEPYETRKTLLSDILGWFKGSPLDTRAILMTSSYDFDDDSVDPSHGDGDGYINPGETIELNVTIMNSGTLDANNVEAILRTGNEFITIIDSSQIVGDILSGTSIETPGAFTFFVDESTTHETPISFTLIFTDSTSNRWDEELQATVYLSNTINGQVTDAGTGLGISGAQLNWAGPIDDFGIARDGGIITTGLFGNYSLSGPIGSYGLRAIASGYIFSEAVFVDLPPDTVINFVLTSPEIAVSMDSISVALIQGETFLDTLQIQNKRTGQLIFNILETNPIPLNLTSLASPVLFNSLSFNAPSGRNELAKSNASNNSTSPDPAKWKLMHVDQDEAEVELDLHECFIQNNDEDIFFKITAHENWGNPVSEFLVAIFIDVDENFATGNQINNIGADYVIALGSLGDLILSWSGGGWNPISGNFVPHHLIFSPGEDSLEVGIHLSQIGNPKSIRIVTTFLLSQQSIVDAAPDNGLFYIPYSMFDAPWLDESSFYGAISGGDHADIFLSFNTKKLDPGSYLAHLVIPNNQPETEPTVIPVRLSVGATNVADDAQNLIPTKFMLHSNYPNPFNPETIIKFDLPKGGQVKLEIYNMLGQRVNRLVNEFKEAGYHQIHWNGKTDIGGSATSGIYFYRLEMEDFLAVKKMLMLQ